MSPETRRQAADGVRAVAALLVGVVPFGLVFGATAADNGLDWRGVAGFSIGVFAGASQLAAVDLLGRDAPVLVAAMTAIVINLRMLLYSASLAPWLSDVGLRRRAAAAYLLTDQAYAVSIARYTSRPHEGARLPFYLGAGWALWVTWQLSTQAGVVVGDSVPDDLPIELAIPLVFLVLLMPALVDRPTVVAAAVAAGVAVVAVPLPANLGMPLAAVSGIVAGTVTDLWLTRQGSRP